MKYIDSVAIWMSIIWPLLAGHASIERFRSRSLYRMSFRLSRNEVAFTAHSYCSTHIFFFSIRSFSSVNSNEILFSNNAIMKPFRICILCNTIIECLNKNARSASQMQQLLQIANHNENRIRFGAPCNTAFPMRAHGKRMRLINFQAIVFAQQIDLNIEYLYHLFVHFSSRLLFFFLHFASGRLPFRPASRAIHE